MPRKIQRDGVQIDYTKTGSLRAEDLPYNASESIKTSVDARTPPEVTTLDDGKLTQAYYETPPVYGDEADGDVTISSGGSGVELSYINDVTDMTSDAPLGATSLNVRDGSAFSQGDEIMLHQTQCYRDPTKRFQYEFRRIASVVGNVINLTVGLSKAFDSDSGALNGDDTKTQVIRVPNYNILTLNSGAGICARPWNGYAGGVLVFRAKTLAGAGVISGNDAGFRNGEFYYTPNDARSCRNEGPMGAAVSYLRTTWEPTGVNENYVSAFHDVGAGGTWYAGGSGQAGTANVVSGTSGTVTIYGPTPYTKDGVNPITGADLEGILPIPTGYFQASISTFQAPFRVYYGNPESQNINCAGNNASGAAILCFVQSHAGFTGSIKSNQVNGSAEPNAGGYVAFFAESPFTGPVDVTTQINGRNGVFGDNGLFYTAAPAVTINKGQQHGPKVVSTDAGSAAGDILNRAAGDERWGGAETDPVVGAVNGLVKADGAGNIAAAVEDTDYQGVLAEGAFADGDKTKLDGIEAGADVTDATNVDAAGATMNADTDVSGNSWVVDEDNMVSDLATKVPTQQSVKAYVDATVASAKSYKGGYDAATNTPDLDTTPIANIKAGDVYDVTVAGTFFTANVEAGDTLTAKQDDPTTEAHWVITQANLTPASIKTQYESNADTNAFTDAEQTKLAGIEAGADVTDAANVNAVESDPVVGAITGLVKANGAGVISAAVEDTDYQGVLAEGAFADGDKTKLDGIEAGADVTDAANVNAVESDPVVGAINGLVKANGAGTIAAAVEDTDYQGVLAEGAFADGDKTKLDGIASGADVTGSNPPQAHALAGSLHTVPAKTTSTPTGTTETVDWANGPLQELDLGSATGDVTLTLSNPAVGMRYTLLIVQGATSRNVVLPSTVLIPGGSAPNTVTVTATDNAVDKLSLEWDGTNYHAELNQNYG